MARKLLPAIFVTILFFALGEGILWLLGYPRKSPVYNTREDLFWGLNPNLSNYPFLHKERGKNFFVSTNSLGLREREVERTRERGSLRILALGDSTTFGWGVEQNETYPAALEAMLSEMHPGRKIEVLNGGIPGYTAFQGLYLFRRIAPLLDPDIVLFAYIVQDARESSITDKSQAIITRAPEFLRNNLLYRWRFYLFMRDGITAGKRALVKAVGRGAEPVVRVPLSDYRECILAFEEICRKEGRVLVLFGFPLEVSGYTTPHRKLLYDVAKEKGIFYFDPSDKVARLSQMKPLFFAEDRGHPTKEGYWEIARLLADYLEKSETLTKGLLRHGQQAQ